MSWIARTGAVAAVVGIAGLAMTRPAMADTGDFGQQVVMCAHMMLPYDLGPDGSITMIMQDGTSMYFPTFGAMVTFMRSSPMCS
jgi:hypothetical protein